MALRLALSTALAITLLTPARAQTGATTATGHPTPTQAQELIERLSGVGQEQGAPQQLIYGALPARIPLKLQAPLTLLASIHKMYTGGSNTRVLLSSDLARDAALAALGRQLTASGWTVRPPYSTPAGFQAPQTDLDRSFVFEPTADASGSAYLAELNAREVNGRTTIDLALTTISAAQLAPLKKQPQPGPQSSLPSLKALPGAKLQTRYGGAGPAGLMSTVYVTKTALSANEVLSSYSVQLKAAGWKAVTDTTTGTLRVITYALTDLNGREALGTLGIRPWEKDGGYVLTTSVQGFKPWDMLGGD